MRNIFEKFGSYGAVVAAAACPICFPKLALFGALFGLGALVKYETLFFFSAQVLVLMALTAHVVSYRKQHNKPLLVLAMVSGSVFFISLYLWPNEYLSYTALLGLISATIWLSISNRQCAQCEAPPA